MLVYFLSGCKSDESKRAELPDMYNRGTIHISCDESFKPVIDEEVGVYEALYPGTKIIVHYKAEAECLKDFGVDSIRMVIATRGYSEGEKNFMIDSMHVEPDKLVVARDLIAVIVNPATRDSFFSMSEIRDLLAGKSKENLIPVFDGTRATSTVRFMLDSVLKGQSLGKNVQAAQNSVDVVNYVSKTPNAVGFVGYGWVGDEEDTSQVSYMRKVKTAYVESTDSAGYYIKPSQYFIYTKSYPMVRDLIYTLKERHMGLGHGFAHFLYTMQGQLIFRRAYLMPVILPNYVRDAELESTINK
ncbi:MAG: PstS family phosphate ABC transporter substrate-binding protein [Flavisolibacter sp.]